MNSRNTILFWLDLWFMPWKLLSKISGISIQILIVNWIMLNIMRVDFFCVNEYGLRLVSEGKFRLYRYLRIADFLLFVYGLCMDYN